MRDYNVCDKDNDCGCGNSYDINVVDNYGY